MVATHIFHKLVISARLFMKKASWGCFRLVFDSSGEPAGYPEFITLVLRVLPGPSLRLVDPNLGVMAKVSSLIEVLRLGGSYELVYRLWAQFTSSAVRVNVDVTWSRDEVLVSNYSLLGIFYVACVHPVC